MPDYSYKAADTTGNIKSGVKFAANEEQLRNMLAQEGLSLISVRLGAGFNALNALKLIQPGGMTRLQIIELFTNISVMLKAGVPLITCLDELREDAEPYIKMVLGVIRDGLTEGGTLHQVMGRRKKDFDGLILNLIQIGEESGYLSEVFENIAKHYRRIDDLIRNTRKAMIYPFFVLVALLFAGFVFLTYVFPPLFTILVEYDVELPLITQVVMSVATVLQDFWVLCLVGVAALIAGFIVMRRYAPTRYPMDWLEIRLPLIQKVFIQLHMTFFLRYMAMMLTAGVDILKALELSANSVSNLVVRKRLSGIRENIVEGSMFSQALGGIGFIPNTIIVMVAVGESSGNLPEQMEYLSEVYNEKLERIISAALAILEPLLIFIMAGLVLAMVMAVLLPLYNMVSTLSTGIGTGGGF